MTRFMTGALVFMLANWAACAADKAATRRRLVTRHPNLAVRYRPIQMRTRRVSVFASPRPVTVCCVSTAKPGR